MSLTVWSGVLFAIQQSTFYLQGAAHFRIVTDHRPLVGIFSKDLCELQNPRLLKYRERMQGYNFSIQWVAGKLHMMADALSRAPLLTENVEYGETPDTLCSISLGMPKDGQFAPDETYQEIVKALKTGSEIKDLPSDHPATELKSMWENLSLDAESDIVLLNGYRMLIPKSERKRILQTLHKAHAGPVKTSQQAKALYFWPGMNNDIDQMIKECRQCMEFAPSQPREPLKQDMKDAEFPFEAVGMDMAHFAGNNYLIMVDRYSGFPFIQKMTSTTTAAICKVLVKWFLEWGFPTRIRSDNGPQFRQQFTAFCEDNGIEHETSSPYNSQSNGLAESAMKNMKTLLKKCKEGKESFDEALLEWKNTPRKDGYSPAMLFIGRRLRTRLPTAHINLRPIDNAVLEKAKVARDQEASKEMERQSQHCRELTHLEIGQNVLIQDPISKRWEYEGTIMSERDSGRSYEVQTGEGGVYIRNRRFLKAHSPEGAQEDTEKKAGSSGSIQTVLFDLRTHSQVAAITQASWENHRARRARPTTANKSTRKRPEGFTSSSSTFPRPTWASASSSPCSSWRSSPSASSAGSGGSSSGRGASSGREQPTTSGTSESSSGSGSPWTTTLKASGNAWAPTSGTGYTAGTTSACKQTSAASSASAGSSKRRAGSKRSKARTKWRASSPSAP